VTPETINRMIQKDSSKIVSVFISIHWYIYKEKN
jgi:hypothetical protein